MKILLVTSSLNGGAGKACYRLYEALLLKKVNVKILCLELLAPVNQNILPFHNNRSKYYLDQIQLLIRNKLKSYFYPINQINYRNIYTHKRIENHPLFEWADIVNLHWISDSINWPTFFIKIKKPIVWTLHDMLPFSGGFHYECDFEIHNKEFESLVEHKKYKYAKNSNLTIVAPSKWLLDISQKHKPFKDKIHTHIFNGIPQDIFKPIEKSWAKQILNLPQDKKIILFSADNIESKRKGLKYLIEAINKIQGYDILAISLGKGIYINNNDKHINIGMFNDEFSLSLVYACADIVVVPSLEDNSPNIIIESLSCGKPVVAFNVGGIPELINDSKLGLLINNINSDSLQLGIQQALCINYDNSYIRNNAILRFGYSTLSYNYLKLYEKTLLSKKGKIK